MFDGGLAANQAANFPWWQDDHNFYIDLKVMLPLRRACQELARRVGRRPQRRHALPVLAGAARRRRRASPTPGELKSLVDDRRQYFDHWHARRSDDAQGAGHRPGVGRGPGAHRDLRHQPRLAAGRAEPGRGQPDHADRGRRGARASPPASPGCCRAPTSCTGSRPGEILVCESTSPNWTPAFGKIAGAVCDGGGMLSHAAIVGREYGVPTVTAVGRRHAGRSATGTRSRWTAPTAGSPSSSARPSWSPDEADVTEVRVAECRRRCGWTTTSSRRPRSRRPGRRWAGSPSCTGAGVQVPQGFAVTVDAYRRHCAESGLDARIDEVIGGLGDRPGATSRWRRRRRGSGSCSRPPRCPTRLTAAITEAYEELCLRCVDVNVPTAVRSSATGEDAADASFAGIFDTYLGVSGTPRVLDAVRRCWGSLFTGRALAYRLRKGISHHDMPIAVGVIELIHARASGVAFSVHPVTGKADRVVIETSLGLGRGDRAGPGRPRPHRGGQVRRAGAAATTSRTRRWSRRSTSPTAGSPRSTCRPSWPTASVLDDEQIAAVTDAVTAIERALRLPGGRRVGDRAAPPGGRPGLHRADPAGHRDRRGAGPGGLRPGGAGPEVRVQRQADPRPLTPDPDTGCGRSDPRW